MTIPDQDAARLKKRISWQVEWAQASEHFQAAHRILEVGSGSFKTIVSLAKKYPEKEFVGIDFSFSDNAAASLKWAPRNITAIRHDIRNLSILSEQQFDFAYSVAVLEHIRELDVHLSSVYSVLREGGRYSFKGGPFWSSSVGHHYEHNSPDCPIPLYGHLLMSKEELGVYLAETAKISPEKIAKVFELVYEREDLSRLSRTETHAIISSSSFTLEEWKENSDQNYTDALGDAVLKSNIYKIDPEDLKVSGVTCTLRRPIELKPKPTILGKILRKLGLCFADPKRA